MPFKEIFYDWGGANLAIFHAINNLHGDIYSWVMMLGTNIASRHNFFIYLFLVSALVLCSVLRTRKIYPDKWQGQGIEWLKIIAVFVLAYIADGYFLEFAKHYFSMPRPFVTIPPESIHLIGRPLEQKDYYLSFPSGHASFAALVAASLWPVLKHYGKILAIIFVLWVCCSRMALGVHYPVDVMAGAASAALIVFLIHYIINAMLICINQQYKRKK